MKFLEKEIMVLKRKGAASAAHRWMKMLRHGSVALLLGSAAGAASATAYTVTQLPSLGGTYTWAPSAAATAGASQSTARGRWSAGRPPRAI